MAPDSRTRAAEVDKVAARAVTAVIVSYGHRAQLANCVISALQDEGVGRIVLVDNGMQSKDDLLAATGKGTKVDVLTLEENMGSAFGFAAGMKHALDTGAEYLWLLDDDNVPTPGCLDTLLSSYVKLAGTKKRELLAVSSYRAPHQSDIVLGYPDALARPRASSFNGFHLVDVPAKLRRKIGTRRDAGNAEHSGGIPLKTAPYGGLFFHAALVSRFGLPKEEFVLYEDDTEYTYRIISGGGAIFLIPSAQIHELERSWGFVPGYTNTFSRIVHGGTDVRVYYGTRNRAYFDSHCLKRSWAPFIVNVFLYCLLVFFAAIVSARFRRCRLIATAMADGFLGRLGPNARFPISRPD